MQQYPPPQYPTGWSNPVGPPPPNQGGYQYDPMMPQQHDPMYQSGYASRPPYGQPMRMQGGYPPQYEQMMPPSGYPSGPQPRNGPYVRPPPAQMGYVGQDPASVPAAYPMGYGEPQQYNPGPYGAPPPNQWAPGGQMQPHQMMQPKGYGYNANSAPRMMPYMGSEANNGSYDDNRSGGGDTKKFICHYHNCGRGFTQKNNLARHIRTVHERRRRFACPYKGCEKKFAEKNTMTIHVCSVHRKETSEQELEKLGVKTRFVCEHEGCGRIFSVKSRLQMHMQAYHKNKDECVSKPDNDKAMDDEGVGKNQANSVKNEKSGDDDDSSSRGGPLQKQKSSDKSNDNGTGSDGADNTATVTEEKRSSESVHSDDTDEDN